MVELHITGRRPVLICSGAISAIVRILLASALAWCSGTMAAAGADLYRAQAVVTGQGEANRIIGFASCLEDVLIKVSGAQKLAATKPSDAVSVVLPRSCLITASREGGVDSIPP